MRKFTLLPICFLFFVTLAFGQTVSVGAGSYTNVFPGTDEAGRNAYPSGMPNVTRIAAQKPVSSNGWWANFLKNDFGEGAFNYPLSFRAEPDGLVINYTWPLGGGTPDDFREPMSAVDGIKVGVQNLSAAKSSVADYSDWTVTLNWNDGSRDFSSTMGQGMPFVYFTKGASDVASVFVGFNPGSVSVSGNKLLIENNINGSAYVVYAPTGASWSQNGDYFTSDLNGKDYWSMVLVPDGQDINVVAGEYEEYAYAFPTNTQVSWNYDENASSLQTVFSITAEPKEGTSSAVLQGLLPHHWSHLSSQSAVPQGYSYKTVRGEMKTLAGNEFIVENNFSGILPTLPNLGQYSQGYSSAELIGKIDQIKSEALNTWTDSYNDGQAMNRLLQVARIADQIGYTEARDQLLNTVKTRLEDWLSYESGEVAFLFYYNDDWDALLGYPPGYGQDSNLNDHHFHWGYFIHAAVAMEQFFPGWADQWGDMVNMLVRDAANPVRNDNQFPFLRSFSPFGGHCWANGFGSSPFGTDQESSSESMQFNSALIHWGQITGNQDLRDLGIYLYTTEQSAIEEYWFDIHQRNFQPSYQHEMVARIWGAGYDNGTFWTGDIAAAYGIELYPIHGGSLYLGHHPDYVKRVWEGMKANTEVLNNTPNDNLWYDVYWKYLAFYDSDKALELYNSYPDRNLKFGISDAQTYHWLHNMNSLGQVRNDILPDYPIAAAFDKNGQITYVAHNYGDQQITVHFSDGGTLDVPPHSMATNRDSDVEVSLTTSQTEVPTNGGVTLTSTISGGTVDKIEFLDNNQVIGTVTAEPYELVVDNLSAGLKSYVARAVSGNQIVLSNVVQVQVGSQIPYGGQPWAIPGEIEAGKYDVYEGGIGQGIAYYDNVTHNQAQTFRNDEYVDAGLDPNEGANVGWIEAGEWLEYTVDVAQAGTYNVQIRYASGVTSGGPFHFSVNGNSVSSGFELNGTGDWGNWVSYTIQGLELEAGQQVLRIEFDNGGFNLGKMVFEYAGQSGTNFSPSAKAGSDVSVQLPLSSVVLDGTQSSDPDGSVASFLWNQVDGPSVANVVTPAEAVTTVENLVEGTYTFQLTVTDDQGATATDEVAVVVQPENSSTNPGICQETDDSGDFSWVVQESAGNTTLTFVPEIQGVGDPVLLFYQSTDPNAVFPGAAIQPNVPVALNVDQGTELFFYFTYSHPDGGERNTANRVASFVAGSCSTATSVPAMETQSIEVNIYPNPFADEIYVQATGNYNHLQILDMSGKVVLDQPFVGERRISQLGQVKKGIYFMVLSGRDGSVVKKLIKQE